MKQRKILIVDDNKSIATTIDLYKVIAHKLESEVNEYNGYELVFDYKQSISDAKLYLEENRIIDVLLIDYRFNNSPTENGAKLIEFIRSNINKHCRIIFYTMNSLSAIPTEELVSLVNNGVYKIIDKADDNRLVVDTIYKAAITCDPVVVALERFTEEYGELLDNYDYSFMGNSYPMNSIIEHIRMDDPIGQEIIYKLLHKAIISSIDI